MSKVFGNKEEILHWKLDILVDTLAVFQSEDRTNREQIYPKLFNLIDTIRDDVTDIEKILIDSKDEEYSDEEMSECIVEYHDPEHWEGFQVQDKD
jgi:hypothetical protein